MIRRRSTTAGSGISDGLGFAIEFDKIADGAYLPVVLDLDFDHIRAVYLRVPGGQFVELLECHGIERLPAASRSSDYGAGHFCFHVEGDGLYGRLIEIGLRARSDSVVAITEGLSQGVRSVYMLDLDGYRVDLPRSVKWLDPRANVGMCGNSAALPGSRLTGQEHGVPFR